MHRHTFRVVLVMIAVLSAASLAYSHPTRHLPIDGLTIANAQLIAQVRGATAGFRDVEQAEAAGYGIFQDCFNSTDIGGMGQHYVHGELVGDGEVDPLRPEAVVYEPREDGELILVALEYIIFESNWEGDAPPTLFGQEFHLNPNIPDTPPAWVLHIWLHTHNPEGMFADFNPLVFCPENASITEF